MAMPIIAEYVRLLRMNVPRTELCYTQIRSLARELGDDRLFELCQRGFATSRRVSQLNTLRKIQSDARGEGVDDQFDTDMDDAARPLIKALIDAAEYMTRTRHADAARVNRLRRVHFPTGPGDIISQRYEEQLHRTRALIADLRGAYADLLDELEVERKLRRVEALVEPYEQALVARTKVTAAEVRAAALEMHERTLIVVAHILAAWHDEPEVMHKLMMPLLDQQARISAIIKARRAGNAADDDPSRDEDDIIAAEGMDGEGADAPPAELADPQDAVNAPPAEAEAPGEPADSRDARDTQPPFPGVIPVPQPGDQLEGLPGPSSSEDDPR